MKKPSTQSGTGSRIHIHHSSGSNEDRQARSVLRIYYLRHIRHDRIKFLNQIAKSKQTLAQYDVFILYSEDGNKFFDKPGKILTYAWQWQQYGQFIRIWKRDDGLHFRAISFDSILRTPDNILSKNRRNLTREARTYILRTLKEQLLIE